MIALNERGRPIRYYVGPGGMIEWAGSIDRLVERILQAEPDCTQTRDELVIEICEGHAHGWRAAREHLPEPTV